MDKQKIDKQKIDKKKIDKKKNDKKKIHKQKIDKKKIDKQKIDKQKIDKQKIDKKKIHKQKIDKQLLFKKLDEYYSVDNNEISIFIFRRDYRFIDNIGIKECLHYSKKVYPVFIFTPEQISNKNKFKSSASVEFIIQSLTELNKTSGNKITFFYDTNENFIKSIIKYNNIIDKNTKNKKENNKEHSNNNQKITSIYTNTDYTNYAVKRDKNIRELCEKNGIKFVTYDDICLVKPGTILNGSGNIYQKFTPFYRSELKYLKKNQIPVFRKYHAERLYNISEISEIDCKKIELDDIFKMGFYKKLGDSLNVKGGRKNALKYLYDVVKFKDYEKIRNDLSDNTTLLSAYIKFGCVSIREVFRKIKNKFGIDHTLIQQLIWRDFYYNLGYGFPEKFGKALKDKYNKINWINTIESNKHFKLWCAGKTGYPIVDAGMTQLNKTGYMHNRVRMIVASFLIKNLGVDWRKGEKYFATKLIDYDVLVNNGNWQWVSGTGADSQPYFRVFNPALQAAKFDPNCDYIKKWLPNLEKINNKHLHDWEKYNSDYKDSYISNTLKYYKPIISYKESKNNVLELYKKIY
jgi:deoxyribodipyrimidine photo-lyase